MSTVSQTGIGRAREREHGELTACHLKREREQASSKGGR